MSLYEICSEGNKGSLEATIECVAAAVESQRHDGVILAHDISTWLMIICGALVFSMQAGFSMICAGAVRKKHLNNTMMKNLLDACAAAVAFFACGHGLAYGSTRSLSKTVIGINNFFLRGENVSYAEVFLQYSFSTASVTIVASTLAERCTMTAYIFYAFMLAGFVYPIVVHAVWTNTGILTNMSGISFLDCAGSGVVHLTGGMTALIASVILGPRYGRFYEVDGKPCVGLVRGNSVPLQLLGTFILWFGWYGFNAGSTLTLTTNDKASVAGQAVITTTLSGACGCLSALVSKSACILWKKGEFSLDITAAMNGSLAGLVAITGGCYVVESGSSIVIGIVAGWLYLGSKHLLEICKVDDAVDAIPVHMVNGIWGLLSTGLLASPTRLFAAFGDSRPPGWLYSFSDGSLLAGQIVGILAILLWVTVTMLPLFILLDKGGSFRISEVDELLGLDATYHGGKLPTHLCDDESNELNKDERLKAYQQQFQDKLERRRRSGRDDVNRPSSSSAQNEPIRMEP